MRVHAVHMYHHSDLVMQPLALFLMGALAIVDWYWVVRHGLDVEILYGGSNDVCICMLVNAVFYLMITAVSVFLGIDIPSYICTAIKGTRFCSIFVSKDIKEYFQQNKYYTNWTINRTLCG